MTSVVKVFEITIPQKSDLCCAICRIVNIENVPLIYSKFCLNKLRCRQFLRETPQAMAAPITNRKILQAGGSIYVIVTKEFFESCTFQDHCDALNIQMMDVLDSIPTYIYKACLLHTMEYKLSPQWNKVGLYLVEGQNFLSSTGNVNAITLDIKEIRGNFARIQVEVVNLKIPFVRLNKTRPTQYDQDQPPVRVLPSMKMANVICISKTIKTKHLFKDYEHLRTYWKDMHGYILPAYEEGFLFYDVEFFYFKSNVFLYPDMCLTSGPLQVFSPSIDPVPIIYKFAGELRGRVTKLCGQQLDVCPENTYQAGVLAYTPALPRTGKFLTYDTGYGTQSRKINSIASSFRMPDTCEIPIKKTRLSLSKTNDSLTCESDFDFGVNPTPCSTPCSTNEFQQSQSVDDSLLLSMLCDPDITMTSKPIIKKTESKSHYFKEQEALSQSKSLTELIDKPKNLSLKEKLLKNEDNE